MGGAGCPIQQQGASPSTEILVHALPPRPSDTPGTVRARMRRSGAVSAHFGEYHVGREPNVPCFDRDCARALVLHSEDVSGCKTRPTGPLEHQLSSRHRGRSSMGVPCRARVHIRTGTIDLIFDAASRHAILCSTLAADVALNVERENQARPQPGVPAQA